MVLDNEAERIKRTYDKRNKLIPSELYSFFNDANLYAVQSRDREIVNILKSHDKIPLENKKIIDIGCGAGGELRNLIRYGANPINLYGIDLLDNRIETAKRLSPNLHFICKDAKEVPYEDNSFDIIIQFTVFTSILDEQMKKSISQQMMRVLRQNGIIIWYDFHMNNPNNPDVKGITKREINKLFPGCQIKLKRVTLAPPIARIIAPHSMIICHMLEKLSILNTHYLGVIKKAQNE